MKIHPYNFCKILLLTFVFSCSPKKKVENLETATAPKVEAAVFNGDSAYQFVADQVGFGYRIPNTVAHQKCGDYITAMLEKYGCKVTVQAFTAKTHDGKLFRLRNIIGSVAPEAAKRIIVSAHWDTRAKADQDTVDTDKPLDGANDGGSGVGVLLEIARAIGNSDKKPGVGVDLIFWDGEDNGSYEVDGSWCLGSQHWAQNKHTAGYQAYYGINLDMVGSKNAVFAMDGTSLEYARELTKRIWFIGNSIGYSNYFVNKEVENIIDDHYYINSLAHIPMVDIIEYENADGNFFSPSWHTHGDNMQVIDPNTLKAVGQTVVHVLYSE